MSRAAAAPSPVVVLVGPPGSGKTTVGGLLAARLATTLLDTDAAVEAVTGRSVAEIFVDDGEARFRELEEEAVLAALTGHSGVVALGGGAVTSETVRAALTGHRTVFLDVSLAESARRVGLGAGRPLLLGNVRGQLSRLMAARRPLYEAVSAHVVPTDGRDAAAVAEAVAAALRQGAAG